MAQTLDLAQAPLHVPSPLSPPPTQHVEEPVASDGVDVDLAALRTAAAGLVFNECGGWGGWRGCGGTGSLGVGELLVCERPVDGFSWSPPDWALQTDSAEARGGRGCAPEERVPRAVRVPVWRPARPARRRARQNPD